MTIMLRRFPQFYGLVACPYREGLAWHREEAPGRADTAFTSVHEYRTVRGRQTYMVPGTRTGTRTRYQYRWEKLLHAGYISSII